MNSSFRLFLVKFMSNAKYAIVKPDNDFVLMEGCRGKLNKKDWGGNKYCEAKFDLKGAGMQTWK